MLNLDTHVLIFAVTGQLRPAERRKLGREPWGISAIVLWEITKLHQLGRITFDLADRRVQGLLGQLQIWPIEVRVCQQLARLDFRADPADELIAATSLAHEVPLVTRDRRIRASKVVPLA